MSSSTSWISIVAFISAMAIVRYCFYYRRLRNQQDMQQQHVYLIQQQQAQPQRYEGYPAGTVYGNPVQGVTVAAYGSAGDPQQQVGYPSYHIEGSSYTTNDKKPVAGEPVN